MDIGKVSAETDDDFLFECFVQYPAVTSCADVNSHGMVLTGRTGSGKTAIIRHICRIAEHSTQIDPSEIAMGYISNSDCLNFLSSVGADLDLIFQYLWKHVLCIEYVRLRWNVKDEETSKNIFLRLFDIFAKDDRKKKALKYLKGWEGKFWITMDENVKEITRKIEDSIKAELGAELGAFRANSSYVGGLTSEQKSEIVTRSRKIINSDQLSELSSVIDLLSDKDKAADIQNKYYILIDKLDERWVDASIRFRLIRSLIESLKTFRRIPNLKIIVALRTDVLERVVQETRDLTFQREKYDDYFVRIRWTKLHLKQLVDSRITTLFRRQYTGRAIRFGDVFPHNVGNVDPFEFMLEKTLYRPRDIIAFVNECLLVAENNYQVTGQLIRKAEVEFSRIRRDSLEQEWESAFLTLRKQLDYLSVRRRESFSFRELCEDEVLQMMILELGTDSTDNRDPLCKVAQKYNDLGAQGIIAFVREMLAILYRVGAVGIKFYPSEKYKYSHLNEPIVTAATIPEECQVRVHPMLHSALKLRERLAA